MKIAGFDTAKRVLVVAEIGNNHEGSQSRAEELVRAAADCGVHAVKFQTFVAERFVSPSDPARLARLKSFELSQDGFRRLAKLARSLGLKFISTPLDIASVDFLDEIVDALKIASGDNDFYPLISRAASKRKPLIISTGLCDASQARRAVAAARGAAALALLHCVCHYPVEPDQANLRGLEALKTIFPHLTIGYSDHTIGLEACLLSVALGARIIEKHFTLDKNQSEFRDHKLSADPTDMRELVRRVDEAQRLLGSPVKRLMPCEAPMLPLVRRSIAAASDLPTGHQLRMQDLLWLRPSGGFRPGEEARVIGRHLGRAVSRGEAITGEVLR